MAKRYYHGWQPVVAKKKYLGVTVGYMVGWKSRYCDFVRNIRAGLFFDTESKARDFRKTMEKNRVDPVASFEILED